MQDLNCSLFKVSTYSIMLVYNMDLLEQSGRQITYIFVPIKLLQPHVLTQSSSHKTEEWPSYIGYINLSCPCGSFIHAFSYL